MVNSAASRSGRTLVFIDGAIAHSSHLIQGLQPGVEVIMLDANRDGVLQITQALKGRIGIDSLHIFSHGEAGGMQLGSTRLTGDRLSQYADALQHWGNSLSTTGDILLYGCNIAQGSIGSDFVQRLSQLTGAEVAASTNLTGRGGDWVLEARTGSIEAGNPLSPQARAAYTGTLNVLWVVNNDNGSAGSLRWAVENAASGTTIRFAPGLANQTITLTSGEISIATNKNLIIDGADAPNLTISGNNQSRIFYLNSTSVQPTRLTIRNLTLANGSTQEYGGAIRTTHQGGLEIDNVRFLNNSARQGGGAIFSAFEGTVTVTNSRFEGNRATAGNDERGAGAIAFWGPRALTVRNSDFINNRGINGGAINSLGGKMTIEDSRFIGNSTLDARFDTGRANPFLRGYGGAVYADRASADGDTSGFITINRTVFENNQGRGEGGAAYLFTDPRDRITINDSLFLNNAIQPLPNGGNAGNGGGLVVLGDQVNRGLLIDRSSFVGNLAGNQGGGLWTRNAPANIINSTFSGNRTALSPGNSNQNGGAMTLYSPTNIINTTIANNYAGWVGGGIATDNSAVTLRNSIFANNSAGNGGNDWRIRQQTSRALTDLGGNLQFPDLSSNQFNRFNDNLATPTIRVADPRLGQLQRHSGFLLYHPLLPDSPAINTGVAGGAGFDQRLVQRDGLLDAGAFEALSGGPNDDVLVGTASVDTILGRRGNDQLTGGGGGDFLLGGNGSDRFLYRGPTRQDAFAGSRVGGVDKIQDFDATAGDRIQIVIDNPRNPATLPVGLFHAGTVFADSLSLAMTAAATDKDRQLAGAQSLAAHEAVFFRWSNQVYLAVNDSIVGLDASRDLVINMTGMVFMPEHIGQGTLSVNSYFA